MATPRQIGGYDVTDSLGKLPIGESFSGRDPDGRPVTLLRLDHDALLGRQDLETLLQTLDDLRKLDIAGMLPVLGAGKMGHDVVVVLRGTDGPTLEDILARGPLDASRVVRIARQLAECLERLHAAETPHGDVHPGNVHLPGGGEAWLGPPAFLPFTRDELMISFVAPEVLEGGADNEASDVFSLGAIMYRALTGKAPFGGRTASQVLRSIHGGVIEDPIGLVPDLPPGLPELMLRMLDETAAMRPTDVAARLGEIEDAPAVEPEAEEIVVEFAPDASSSAAPARLPAPARLAPVSPGPRNRVGRLILPRAGTDETLQHDLIDDHVHLGVSDTGGIVLSSEPFGGAVCRLVREPTRDVVEARPDAAERARINGSLFDRHELVQGDILAISGREIRYELEPATVRPVPGLASNGPKPASSPSERILLAVSLLLSALVLVGLFLGYGNASRRGQDVIDRAEEAREKAFGRIPPPSTRVGAEDAAAAALEEATGLARDDPRDYAGRRKLLELVLEKYPGTRASRQASEALATFHKEEARAEMQEMVDAIEKADRLVDSGRLHDAGRVFRAYAIRWKGTPSAARAERNAVRLERRIAQRFEVDGEQVDALVRAGDIVGALDQLVHVLVYASPEVEKKVQERMVELKRRIDETLREPEGGMPPDEADPAAVGPKEAAPPRPLPEAKDPREEAWKRSEERALKVLDSAFEDARTGLYGRVRELARLLLTTLSTTNVAKENRQRVELLFRLATLEADGPTGLLHGKVEHLKKGRIRVSYDFSEPKQLEDWTYLKPFAVLEGGSFEPVPGQATLQGLGTGAFLLDLVLEGDMTVAFRFRSERPHDVGPALFDPDNEMRHILFAVSNTFFTLSIRRDPLPGHVILLFGRGAWADTPMGELGFIRVAQSDEPPVHAGSWTYMACGRRRGKAFFSIGGKTLTGSTLGDDKKGYGDLRPALFVLKSRAQFADVVVEGKPSRIWVAEHKQELRKLLDLSR